MSEIKPNIRILRDVGYKVIMKKEDGSPRQVLRCFVKEGDYGKFISVETHWVQKMEGKKIVDTQWARKTYSFPYDKERALEKWNSVRELLEKALGAGAGAGVELEREVEEEFGEELEGVGEEF
ncbi:MAG: hypothetical protein N2V75_02410 [Methanophagales archaeon]|nr:hypothetical protein [Methanophagales archaeon]RLG34948.1 MAG: hypothetical protein DRN97_01090 [Methanosarcinales archaeon]